MADLTNELNRTTNAVEIPEVWSSLVLEFQKENLVLANLVERRDMDVVNFGDVIHFPVTAALTAATYADGERATEHLSANTDTEVTITINQAPWINFCIVWTLSAQSKYDIKAERLRAAVHGVNKSIDTYLAALVTGFTNSVTNSGGGSLVLDDVVNSFTALNSANVPAENRSWVFKPTCYGDLLKLTSNYFTSIEFQGNKAMVDGKIGMLLGSPVYFSTNLASTGSPAVIQNMYFHKQAIGLAMQKDVKVESSYDQDAQGDLVTVKSLYGAGILRGDYGVQIQR